MEQAAVGAIHSDILWLLSTVHRLITMELHTGLVIESPSCSQPQHHQRLRVPYDNGQPVVPSYVDPPRAREHYLAATPLEPNDLVIKVETSSGLRDCDDICTPSRQ